MSVFSHTIFPMKTTLSLIRLAALVGFLFCFANLATQNAFGQCSGCPDFSGERSCAACHSFNYEYWPGNCHTCQSGYAASPEAAKLSTQEQAKRGLLVMVVSKSGMQLALNPQWRKIKMPTTHDIDALKAKESMKPCSAKAKTATQ